MKIGVFGDSYAERTATNIWWQFLQTEYGHNVTCFGESASSIMFSANLIQQHGNEFDLIIWCVTTPGRFSVKVKSKYLHFTGTNDKINTIDEESQQIAQAIGMYRRSLFDWDTENLMGKAIVHYMRSQFNIMLVPTFPPPIYTYPDPIGFNLYTLSEREAKKYFPNSTLSNIYQNHHDLRPGHLTLKNHEILAKKINQNLTAGIFTADYNDFVEPTELFDSTFRKIRS